MGLQNLFNPATLRKDIPASLVVFLVAVPLSLGIALASGAPIVSGLIAAVIGGIVVGLAGGVPLQVSGPAAGLSVMVFGFIQQFGWAEMCLITIAAGGMQMLLGALRVARLCVAITPAVVHGMLAGIGILIALAQLHVILGGSPQESGLANIRELPNQIVHMHGPAALLGLLTIGLLVVWQFMPKGVRVVPGALVAVGVATAVSLIFSMPVKRVVLPESLLSGFSLAHLPEWGHVPALLGAALALALVASLESLLSAIATDKMHTGARSDLNRELVGQGIGNTISGFVGGLPVTGVIVRSSTNIQAGAQTRLSGILHGVWILVTTALFVKEIDAIPLAALAGLLVYVGVRLVNLEHIRELRHHKEIWIYAVTVAGVVLINLLAGVGIGIGLSILVLLWKLATTRILTEQRDGQWHVRIGGSLTFLSVPRLSAVLTALPEGQKVDVDLEADFMDHAGFEALHGWRMMYERRGGKVDIDERHERWYDHALGGDDHKPEHEMNKVLQGAVRFNSAAGRRERDSLARLARDGQSPQALLLTCVDSRIDPLAMTRAEPGDLLVVRNVGNVASPYDQFSGDGPDPSLAAALDFSLEHLGLRHIIICGHSECGAMKAAMNSKEDGSALQSWLQGAAASVARWRGQASHAEELAPHNQLAQVNVLQQLDNLATYPQVRERLERGQLSLHGWYFDLAHAEVQAYDPQRRRFAPLDPDLAGQMLRQMEAIAA